MMNQQFGTWAIYFLLVVHSRKNCGPKACFQMTSISVDCYVLWRLRGSVGGVILHGVVLRRGLEFVKG
jgi:hypothetical protein